MSPRENVGLGGGGAGDAFSVALYASQYTNLNAGFLSIRFTNLALAAAAAAARSAFEVPGLLDADTSVPKRFVGLGATMLAFGRAAVDPGTDFVSVEGSGDRCAFV